MAFGPPKRNSSNVKSRPKAGATPHTSRKRGAAKACFTLSGNSPDTSAPSCVSYPVMARHDEFDRSQSLSRTGATTVLALRRLRWLICMSSSPSGKGSGLRRTALIVEKTALFAPMPNARVSITVTVNPGVFARALTASRRCRFIGCHRHENGPHGWHGGLLLKGRSMTPTYPAISISWALIDRPYRYFEQAIEVPLAQASRL